MARPLSAFVVLSLVILLTPPSTQSEDASASPNVLPQSEVSIRSSSGRSLFDFGIIRRIANFFGFGPKRDKVSRSSFFQRPEMAPFHFQYSASRRSDSFSPTELDLNGSFKGPRRKKKWSNNVYRLQDQNNAIRKDIHLQNRRPTHRYEILNPHDRTIIPVRDLSRSSDSKQEETFNGKAKQLGAKGNPVDLHTAASQHIFNKYRKEDPKNIYKTDEIITTQKKIQKEKQTNVHSNFAIKNYASKTEEKESKYFGKETNFSNKKEGSSHLANQNVAPFKNSLRPSKPVHPYPFIVPPSVNKKIKFAGDKINYQNNFDHQAIVNNPNYNVGYIYQKNPSKKKGILENVTKFASKVFTKVFPQQTDIKAERRRHKGPSPTFIPPTIPSNSIPNEIRGKSNNGFTPSPQLGIIAEDSFQPLLVPSIPVDKKLPSNAMKPLIIPQNRKSLKNISHEKKEPELIDFFSDFNPKKNISD